MQPLKFSLLLAVSSLAIAVCQAEERPAYAEAVALAKERGYKRDSGDPSAPPKLVYVLGPNSTEEIAEVQGKEVRKRIPFCVVYNRPDTVGDVLRDKGISPNQAVAVEILRGGKDKPVVRIEGTGSELNMSQYPLQAEDVLIIHEKVEPKK